MNSIDQELIEAAGDNNLPDVRRLVRAGADIEVVDDDGLTPLQQASTKGHAQVVKELLEHGADAEVVNSSSRTPLHASHRNGHCQRFTDPQR